MDPGKQTNKSLSDATISESEVKCPLCQYVWNTSRKDRTVNCPNCNKRIPNPYSKNPGKFVTCKKCNHYWCTVVNDKVIICPKCLNQNINPTFAPKREEKPMEYPYVKCSKCDYRWYYKGEKNIGELVLCPNCSRLVGLYPAVNEAIDISKPRSKFGTTIRTEPPELSKVMPSQIVQEKNQRTIQSSPRREKTIPVPGKFQQNLKNPETTVPNTQDLYISIMKPEERLTLHIELLRARIDVLEMSLHLDKNSWQISAKRVNDTANDIMGIIEDTVVQNTDNSQIERDISVVEIAYEQKPISKEPVPWSLPNKLRGIKGKWGVYEVDPAGKSTAIAALPRDQAWKKAYMICSEAILGTRSEVRSIVEQAIDVRYVKTTDGVKKEWEIPL